MLLPTLALKISTGCRAGCEDKLEVDMRTKLAERYKELALYTDSDEEKVTVQR